MGDELGVVGNDADVVAGNAVELHGAVEVHASSIALDQIGVIEVAAYKRAAATNSDVVVKNMLVLHAAIELYADTVGEDLVGPRGTDETECSGPSHRAAHAGGVAVDAVAAQVGRRLISNSEGGTVEVIVLN